MITSPDELACAQLSIRANYLADIHDMEGFVSLFIDDAELLLRGRSIVGSAAIMDFMRGRSRDRITRHVLAYPVVELLGTAQARSVSYFTLFEASAADAAAAPYPLHEPTVLGENHDEYRMTPNGWRLSRREVVPVFRRKD